MTNGLLRGNMIRFRKKILANWDEKPEERNIPLPLKRTVFSLLCTLLVLTSCENDLAIVNRISSQKDALKETGKGVQALYSDQGKVKAQLQAPVMTHMDDPKDSYTELPAGLTMFFYDDSL